ncbi:hypothetical protein ACCC92_03070 [Mucilaginibacter sp. Mucisp84]|uniref:hypothetical protein n=1 Tax=Mucilaginibacter sp. Mucisp84 TaxID=3243058 RepID=UPI0039A5509D
MNWLHFCLWVCGIYMLYYLVIILADLARARSPTRPDTQEIYFSEDVKPELLKAEDHAPAAKPQQSMIGSGGVSLKEAFGLARKDMLVYTRAVSFG